MTAHTPQVNELQAQHTPGPWHIGAESVDEQFIENTTKGWPWFVHRDRRGMGDVGEHMAIGIQSIANARLIAAAPDLLAALQKYGRHEDHCQMRRVIPVAQMVCTCGLDATIAKAEGK